MNLAKFLKGCTTIGELMNMPLKYLEVMYKQYFDTILDPKKAEEIANQQAAEEIEEAVTG